jgi:hypothetical protein
MKENILATSSLVRFENKHVFFYFEKYSSLGTTCNAGVVGSCLYVNLEVVGRALGVDFI